MAYKIKLNIFEGPLDLLLYLIKKNDIDVKDIPISEITEQYMEYIEMMKMLDLNVVGDFLVMAATLMQIKSKMLLPPDPTDEEEAEDPRDELVQRLQEYQQFQVVADELKNKEIKRRDLFGRQVDEAAMDKLKRDAREVYFEANLFDLINALSDALKKAPEDILHEIVKEEYTVEQKVHEILHLLLDQPSVMLQDLFEKSKSRMEVIVTFLSVLELIRLKEIKIVQKKIFSPIEILRNTDVIEPPQTSEHSNVSESSESLEAPESSEN